MPKFCVKISVQKKISPEHVFDGLVPVQPGTNTPYNICSIDVNSEWVVGKDGEMPDGFCPWAWRDLYKDLAVLRFGGDFGFWVESPYMYTACSDGIRPVIFKLERLDN